MLFASIVEIHGVLFKIDFHWLLTVLSQSGVNLKTNKQSISPIMYEVHMASLTNKRHQMYEVHMASKTNKRHYYLSRLRFSHDNT